MRSNKQPPKAKPQQPEKKASNYRDESNADLDRHIRMYGSLYVIAHGLTSWDIERPELLTHLTAILDGESDDLTRGVMLELCARFSFMATEEFEAAFREYSSSIASPIWPNTAKGGKA